MKAKWLQSEIDLMRKLYIDNWPVSEIADMTGKTPRQVYDRIAIDQKRGELPKLGMRYNWTRPKKFPQNDSFPYEIKDGIKIYKTGYAIGIFAPRTAR